MNIEETTDREQTTTIARAWAVTRRDGLVLGFTDHDAELRFADITFRPQSGMGARALIQATGLSVDNSEAIGVLSDEAITQQDLHAGHWDGARIRLWEVDWTRPTQRRLMFRGSLGEVVSSGTAFRAELRGLTEPLNHPRGRIYHPRCAAVLGDMACGVDLDRPGLRSEGQVAQVLGADEWLIDGADLHDAGWFAHGSVLVRSGAAEGLTGIVRADQPRSDGMRLITFWQPPRIQPAIGDMLRLTAGCDKTGRACRLKFDNFLNFRGFPHLPPEDWLLAPQNARATQQGNRGDLPVWAPGDNNGQTP